MAKLEKQTCYIVSMNDIKAINWNDKNEVDSIVLKRKYRRKREWLKIEMVPEDTKVTDARLSWKCNFKIDETN